MRWILLVLLLFPALAFAKDCEPPTREGMEIRGLFSFSECMIDKVAALERENAAIKTELEAIRAALSKFPGELQIDNGRVTRTGGETLVQASFITTARRREGTVALGADQKALEALCAIGCKVNLVLAPEGLRDDDPGTAAVVATCSLHYAAKSGACSLGGCGNPVSGVDGDGKPPGNSGGEVIASAGGACLLADSEPSRSVNSEGGMLGGDRAKGLFLIATPALWTGTEDRFRCVLKLGH